MWKVKQKTEVTFISLDKPTALRQNIEHIVQKCQQAYDPKAQRALYDMFVDRLYYVVVRYVNDHQHTQEVLQDAFVKAFKNIKLYDAAKASFYTWIRTIAVRESIDYCRKRRYDFSAIDEAFLVPSNLVNVLANLEAREIVEVIGQLPDKFRVIFNMYEIEGFSHREIGEMLGITESTSRSYLTRSKKLLQKKISLP